MVVARYHRRSFGIFREAHYPWLEIFPAVIPILDEVVMTFLWIELRRQDKEENIRGGVHLETGMVY